MDEKQRRALGRAAGAARPIGAYAAGALDASARARGFATTSLLSEWGTIVGAELAQFTMPDRVVWPKRRDEAQVADAPKGHRVEGATLVLRVEGPARHRGAAPLRADPRAGERLFRLPGDRRDAHLAGAGCAQSAA